MPKRGPAARFLLYCLLPTAYCLLVCRAASAQDADAAAVVRRAVEAAGGAERLAKFPAARISAAGTLYADGASLTVTAEQVYRVPGQLRTFMQLESARAPKLEVLSVLNGTKGKYSMNGSPVPLTDPVAKEIKAAMLALEVGQLTPLLTDKKFVLKLDKPGLNDPKLAVVVVSVKGAGDMRLGFDRATGQLVRLTRKAYDSSTGKEAEQEQVFSDFKEFQGLVRPTKVVLSKNGEKSLELVTKSFTPLETVDAKEFATE